VGVTPREFSGVQIDTTPDVRVPMTAADSLSTYPEWNSYRKLVYAVVARRHPAASLEQARAEAESLSRAAVEEEGSHSVHQQLYQREPFELQPIAKGLSRLRDRHK